MSDNRRINISEPAVIDTDLTPLSDKFQLEPSDSVEQWVYGNDNTYSPNRTQTPLILTPVISVVDMDSGTAYTPAISNVHYYVLEYNASTFQWEETLVSTVSPGTDADYYILENTNKLVVRKNVSPTSGVTIRCEAYYVDPRDANVTYHVEDSVMLSANQDATAIYPVIDVREQKTTEYNPFTDASSQFSFHASASIDGSDVSAATLFQWYAVSAGTEVLIDTLPCYVSGQGTATLVVDAMYAEDLTIVLRAKADAQAPLYPCKVFRSLMWFIPKIDAKSVCTNGAAVRNSGGSLMHFECLLKMRGRDLTDDMRKHLAFKWIAKKINPANPSDGDLVGWSPTIDMTNAQLINTTAYSTHVKAEVYLLSALKPVTYLGEQVTYNGQPVFAREI